MEVKGKVTRVLDIMTGTGKTGNQWKKQSFVIELEGNSQYPKSLCIDLWGDNIDQYKMAINEMVNCFIDIESREYNGKWFTNVKAWRIEKLNNDEAGINQDQGDPFKDVPVFPSDPNEKPPAEDSAMDDLPF